MASERARRRRAKWRKRLTKRDRVARIVRHDIREFDRWSRHLSRHTWLYGIPSRPESYDEQFSNARAMRDREARELLTRDQLALRESALRSQGEYAGELVDRVVAIIDTSDSAFIARTVAGRVEWVWDGDSVEVAERVRAARLGVRRGE